MKAIIRLLAILFFLAFLPLVALSQTSRFKSEAEARRYYADNIDNLDPIEGIYEVTNTVVAGVSGLSPQRKVENLTCAILRMIKIDSNGNDDDNARFAVLDLSQIKASDSGLVGIIDRIGETNYYKSYRVSASKDVLEVRFQLNNLYSFEYTYDNSYRQAVSKVTFSAIKKYPTRSLYQASLQEKEKDSSSSEWSGTGFALNDGYIVTNYHVVDGAKSIQVHGVRGNTLSDYTASIVAVDKNNDIAIIRISDPRFSGFGSIPYAIEPQMAEVGEDVWVLGYPLTQYLGNEIKLTNGVVSSRSGYQGDLSTYQISAPVQPGSSGGPLFNSKGNVVGIVNAGVPGADNVGYAIKISYLKNLTDSYSLSSCFPSSNKLSSLPLKDQVKEAKDFVFMLICSSK